MSNEQANGVRAGYRTIVVLLALGLTSIGFTRFEDRAIIGVPGSPASARVALASPPAGASEESYAGEPDDSVALSDTSRVPANRIRRILRDRDVANAAARQILAPGPVAPGAGTPLTEEVLPPSATEPLPPLAATPTGFVPLSPPLPGQGVPLFAANLPTNEGGGGTGGGGNPTPDPSPTPTPTPTPTPPPVSTVPEPSTWLMLLMGLFAVGGALRMRRPMVRVQPVRHIG